MSVRRIVHVLASALALVAASAGQQAEAQNWDGSGQARFGVFLQGSQIDYDIRQTPPAGAAFTQTASPNGWGVGIAAGYDLRLGSFVVGGEIDVSFDDGRSMARPSTFEQFGIDYFATARGRLGYVIHPAFMIYGTAGYSMLGAEYKSNTTAIVGGAVGAGNKKFSTLGGFVYGGGLEYDLGWGIGFFEYLRSESDGADFLSARGNRLALESSQDVFRLGLKFKVGHDHGHDVYRRPDSLK